MWRKTFAPALVAIVLVSLFSATFVSASSLEISQTLVATSTVIESSPIPTPIEVSGLYAGGNEPGVIYRYLGGAEWEVISPQLGAAVFSLVEFGGTLFAGTSTSSGYGSGTGKVWKYEGETTWIQVGGNLDSQVQSLVVWNGELYAGTTVNGNGGRLYRYDRVNEGWVKVIDTTSGNYGTWHGFRAMHVWSKNNFLYIGNLGSFKIGRYDGENFRVVLSYNSSPIFDIEQYGEYLYVGGSHGLVYRTSDGSTWGAVFGNCGNDLSQMDVFALKEFQNKLYLGLAPGRWGWEATAQLRSYDGQIHNYWQLTQLVWSKQISSDYEGVISLAKYRGRLFFGTGKAAGYYNGSSTGEVYAYDGNEIELISGRMGYGIQVLLYVPPNMSFDTIAPTSSVNPVAPYWRTLLPFTVTVVASDDLSWVENVELFYRYSSDNVNWGQWTSFGADTASPWKFSFAAPEGDGYYEFYSVAIDGAGNIERPPSEADARAGVDTGAPESSVDLITPYWQNAEALPFKVTATASDALSGVESVTLRYRYSSDNLAWGPWTTFVVDGQEPWEWSFTAPEGDGYYEFYSIARDRATNVEAVLHAGTNYTKTVVPYEWVPRVSTTSVATGDDVGTWYTLPWAFPFWGEPKGRVYISSNGFLIFDPTRATNEWVNSLNGLRARWEIAPFWDDLRTDSAGGIVSTPGVYVDSYSDKIVITWEATRYGGRADSIKFQAVLFRNGDIQLSIAEATNLERFSPTLGISKGDGTNYIDITGERATCKTWKFTMPSTANAWCGVDTTPPVSSVNSIEPYWRNSTTITLTATATDALSGVASISLYYRHSADNVNFVPWAKVATNTAAPWEWTLNLTENTYYEFYSVAQDVAGNTESPPTEADARIAIRPILATVRFKPEVIDLNSEGVFTAFITLPGGYSVADIDLSTVTCEGAPAKSWEITEQGELAVKFRVQDLNVEPGTTELVVTGALTDGTQFIGSDFIMGVTNPSQENHLSTPPTPPPEQPAPTVTIENLIGEDASSGGATLENTISPENSATSESTAPVENVVTAPENTTSPTPTDPAESTILENSSTTSDNMTATEDSAPTMSTGSTSENTASTENVASDGGSLTSSEDTSTENTTSTESSPPTVEDSTSTTETSSSGSASSEPTAESTSSETSTSTEATVSSAPTVAEESPTSGTGSASGGATSESTTTAGGSSSPALTSSAPMTTTMPTTEFMTPEPSELTSSDDTKNETTSSGSPAVSEPEEPDENPSSSPYSHNSHSGNGKLNANVKIEPGVVEIGGKGRVTASIELPDGRWAADINPSTVACRGARGKNGKVVGRMFVAEFDVDDITGLTLGEVELTVTGELNDGTSFEGSDSVLGVGSEAPEPKTEFVSPQNGMPFGTLLTMFGMLTTLFGGSIVGYIMREMKRQVKELSRDLKRVKLAQNPAKWGD